MDTVDSLCQSHALTSIASLTGEACSQLVATVSSPTITAVISIGAMVTVCVVALEDGSVAFGNRLIPIISSSHDDCCCVATEQKTVPGVCGT